MSENNPFNRDPFSPQIAAQQRTPPRNVTNQAPPPPVRRYRASMRNNNSSNSNNDRPRRRTRRNLFLEEQSQPPQPQPIEELSPIMRNINVTNIGIPQYNIVPTPPRRSRFSPTSIDNNNNIENSTELNGQMELLPIKERTRAYILENSPIISKTDVKVRLNNNKIDVYDFEEVDTLELDPFNLDISKIVFKATNSYFQYPKSVFQEHITNMENIIFECKERKIGAPLVNDIVEEHPYYLLRGSSNFVIPLGDIRMLLETSINTFEIKKTNKHLAHTTALESIISSYPYGLLDQQIDIVSADHCQAGTERDVYELIPIVFEAKSGGGGVFSKKKNNKTVHKRNNPFRVHTLTGSKKNIERRRKSINKAKKILGNNNSSTRKNKIKLI